MKLRNFIFVALAFFAIGSQAFAYSSPLLEKSPLEKKKKKEKKEKKKKEKKGKKEKLSKKEKDRAKAEEKLWKKRAKLYSKDPSKLKKLTEAKAASEEQASSALAELEETKAMVAEKEDKIAELQEKVASREDEVASLRSKMKNKKSVAPVQQNDYSSGLVFKVQIGSFKTRDLSKYFKNNPNFAGEVTESGEQRVSIGVFRDYWEADKFKKEIRAMGVRDAWIVPFKDGQRVELKDVISGISQEGEQ